MKEISFIYEAGETRRFHTVPIVRHQNIADHSWHVAMLAYQLYGTCEPGITVQFLMACLSHDMAECKVGDLPAPAKRHMGELLARDSTLGNGAFRELWGEMEERILQPYGLDWAHLLSDEEKRRLKFCDSAEGALYCIKERRMGNQTIGDCFMNFLNYISEIILPAEDVPLVPRPPTISDMEWALRSHIITEWSKANGC